MDPAALAGALRQAAASAGSRWRSSRPPAPPTAASSTRSPDRGRVRRARRVAARRRGVRVRAARLAAPPAPARRDRAGALGDGRLPQELLPAGVVERDARARAARPRGRRLARGLPQSARERGAEPGRQVAADDPALRRAEALDDAARPRRRRHRRDVRRGHRPRGARARRDRRPTPSSSSSAGRSSARCCSGTGRTARMPRRRTPWCRGCGGCCSSRDARSSPRPSSTGARASSSRC